MSHNLKPNKLSKINPTNAYFIKEKEIPPLSSITLKYPELLLDYQIQHQKNIIRASRLFNTTFDGSDTGTGKTFIACALAKEESKRLFVIAPLSTLSVIVHQL